MEELTKQQIVLVTLLVSFVTSIATGIVTVALMDQAPPAVTQTINRVVERTIEKVVPAENQAAVVTKETVVVKEDDLIVKAVEKRAKSLVSIYKVLEGDEGTREIFLGNGLTVSKDGLILTDASAAAAIADGDGNIGPQSFKAVLEGGTAVPLVVASSDEGQGILFLKPVPNGKIKAGLFVPATFSDSGATLKLGQTVIALGGEKLSVGTGIVSGFLGESGTATSSDANAVPNRIIRTDIREAGDTLGSILLTLSGEVVGIRLGPALGGEGKFVPASFVAREIEKLVK